ncbi:hypothetical protein MNB_SV-12-667 [hydrothermal vent metagenome]|uniref:Uncharacterized protein n=1 Tax=hydrothermal vent metagenome TaxID=652676 RepID=A0A1W1BRA9_9ZZZZ
MFRYILPLLVLINIAYAQDKRYFIKLGSFKHFPVLEKTINRMPEYLRSHITIVKSNGWFIPFAYNTTKRYSLNSKLSAYRRYFHDAYIYDLQTILNSPVVRTYVAQKRRTKNRYTRPVKIDNTTPYYPMAKTYPVVQTYPTAKTYSTLSESVKIPKPTTKTVEYNENQGFTKRMISGKRYYLAYKSESNNPNLLVKVSFGNHTVVYQPMMGDMNMREAKYLVENGKLYMFADSFSEEGAYSKIDGYKKDYILVSSWSNGKKLNILRYYYKLNDARSYLGVKGSSDPLANALEDSEIQGVYLPNF